MNRYKQFVIVNYHNGGSYIDCLESDNPIDMARVYDFYVNTQDFDVDKDSLILTDHPTIYNLDDAEKLV